MCEKKMNESSHDTALLLYAISYECRHKNEASIEGILAAEDAINRSAKTYEEMKHSLTLLLSTGLVKQDNKNFKVTTKGDSLLDDATKEKAAVFKHIEKLGELLRPYLEAAKISSDNCLNQIDYENAYRKYYSNT